MRLLILISHFEIHGGERMGDCEIEREEEEEENERERER